MLQSISSVFVVYRCKTLMGSPDPMHANGMDKPCMHLRELNQIAHKSKTWSFQEVYHMQNLVLSARGREKIE